MLLFSTASEKRAYPLTAPKAKVSPHLPWLPLVAIAFTAAMLATTFVATVLTIVFAIIVLFAASATFIVLTAVLASVFSAFSACVRDRTLTSAIKDFHMDYITIKDDSREIRFIINRKARIDLLPSVQVSQLFGTKFRDCLSAQFQVRLDLNITQSLCRYVFYGSVDRLCRLIILHGNRQVPKDTIPALVKWHNWARHCRFIGLRITARFPVFNILACRFPLPVHHSRRQLESLQ